MNSPKAPSIYFVGTWPRGRAANHVAHYKVKINLLSRQNPKNRRSDAGRKQCFSKAWEK
jgi:hypothetical protein